MTADAPDPLIAIGATSRLEPQPKLRSATMMSPALHARRELGVETLERVFSQLDRVDDVAVLAGNDDVGVDVLAVFVRVSAQLRFHLYACLYAATRAATVRGSVIFPVSAEAAQVAGEAR